MTERSMWGIRALPKGVLVLLSGMCDVCASGM